MAIIAKTTTAKKSNPKSKKATSVKSKAKPAAAPKKKLVSTQESVNKLVKSQESAVPVLADMPVSPETLALGLPKEGLSFTTPEGNKVTITVVFINPQMAKMMLQKNLKNRDENKRIIKNLSKKMRKRRWMVNGDTIRFSEPAKHIINGEEVFTDLLIDGQHRLLSIIQSGVSQLCIVIRGLHPDAFATIDEGMKRNAATILNIDGFKNHSKKAGIAKSVILFNNGYYGSIKGGGDQSATPANEEILEFVRTNEEKINEAINHSLEVKKNFSSLDFKALAFMFMIFSKHGKKEAMDFYDQLKLGKKAENPSVKLFCTELIKNDHRETKLPYNTILAYFIKTWNAFKGGKTLDKLSYDKAEEEFPKPL